MKVRVKGDHHIYTCKGLPEIINIQPKGNMAKPYQVKQIREIILRYHIEFRRLISCISMNVSYTGQKKMMLLLLKSRNYPDVWRTERPVGDAIVNAEVVIREWIETARERGQEIPSPRGRFGVCIISCQLFGGNGKGAPGKARQEAGLFLCG